MDDPNVPVPPEIPSAAVDARGGSESYVPSPGHNSWPADDLSREVRHLRRWLTAVTVILGMIVVLSCSGIALTFAGIWGIVDMGTPEAEDQKAALETNIREAYGDDLDSVEIREVEGDYGAPFPFSFIEGGPENMLAVTYRLKGSDVDFADVTYIGFEPGSSGLVPPRNPLGSRIADERLLALLKAYDAETDKPVGSVLRYGASPDYYEGPGSLGSSQEITITVDGEQYNTADLWTVREGKRVKGDKVTMDEPTNALNYVFHLNPETDAFTFVGTEPAEWTPY